MSNIINSKLNIMILNWKSAAQVRQLVGSVCGSNYKCLRIIVINNLSSDDDRDEIRMICESYGKLTEVHLVENHDNLGYAGGNNSGYEYLKRNQFDGHLLIVNPDVILRVDSIRTMLSAINDSVGMVSIRTKGADGKVAYDAIRLHGFMQRMVISTDLVVDTDYCQGACMLVNRKVLDAVGLFDERFFLYWEEVDLSLRIRGMGYRLVCATNSSVIRSRNERLRQPNIFYYSARNAKLIQTKHPDRFSMRGYIPYLCYLFACACMHFPHFNILMASIKGIVMGGFDGIRNRYGPRL